MTQVRNYAKQFRSLNSACFARLRSLEQLMAHRRQSLFLLDFVTT